MGASLCVQKTRSVSPAVWYKQNYVKKRHRRGASIKLEDLPGCAGFHNRNGKRGRSYRWQRYKQNLK